VLPGFVGIYASIQLNALEDAVTNTGFIGAHLYPHWCELPANHAKYYPIYAKCIEPDVPVQMQVGQSLLYSREQRRAGMPGPGDVQYRRAQSRGICPAPSLVQVSLYRDIDSFMDIPWAAGNVAKPSVAPGCMVKLLNYNPTHMR
jgi:hypothetical protein